VAALARVAEHVAAYPAAAAELKYGIVPKATLHRRRTRLSPEESERLERLARVTVMAESVWEDRALAHEFLTSPQPQLGGARPVELARSDLGSRQVEQLLNGLEYALPA
jgi:putative toxin-antitoxin system antitoxin component (TIGR02293 family)